MTEAKTKVWWQSKTIIVSALGIVLGLAKYFLGLDALPESDPETVAAVAGLIGVAFRLITSKSIRGV